MATFLALAIGEYAIFDGNVLPVFGFNKVLVAVECYSINRDVRTVCNFNSRALGTLDNSFTAEICYIPLVAWGIRVRSFDRDVVRIDV